MPPAAALPAPAEPVSPPADAADAAALSDATAVPPPQAGDAPVSWWKQAVGKLTGHRGDEPPTAPSPAPAAEPLASAAPPQVETATPPALRQPPEAQPPAPWPAPAPVPPPPPAAAAVAEPAAQAQPEPAPRVRWIDKLRQGLRTGADVLTRFQHILRTTQESSADRIRELAALARERPEFALADQTLYLLASVQLRAGQEAAAAATFSALASRFPASEWTAYGHKAQADALIEKGACTKARTHLAALAQRQGLIWTSAAAEGFAHCRELDHRRLWLRLALGYLGVLLLGLLAKGRRMLWPPPFEVFYYTPVAAFMVLVSLAIKGGLYLVPVLLLAGLGVALNWLGAAAAAQRAAAGQRGGPLRQLAHVGIGLLLRALAAAAICYVVIDTQGLFELLMETVRNGADE